MWFLQTGWNGFPSKRFLRTIYFIYFGMLPCPVTPIGFLHFWDPGTPINPFIRNMILWGGEPHPKIDYTCKITVRMIYWRWISQGLVKRYHLDLVILQKRGLKNQGWVGWLTGRHPAGLNGAMFSCLAIGTLGRTVAWHEFWRALQYLIGFQSLKEN